jgi:hypothetical protein
VPSVHQLRLGRRQQPHVPPDRLDRRSRYRSPRPSAATQIGHDADGGWIISDTGRAPVRYDDRDIRISILWKAQVRPGPESGTAAPLRPETIIEIISADLTRRGVQAPGQVASLSDQGWLDLVHSAYYIPVSAATP